MGKHHTHNELFDEDQPWVNDLPSLTKGLPDSIEFDTWPMDKPDQQLMMALLDKAGYEQDSRMPRVWWLKKEERNV